MRRILGPRIVRIATLVCQGLIVLRHQGPRALARSVADWRRAAGLNRARTESAIAWRERSSVEGGRAHPLVSVVVRTRNRPADLRVALDSLASQTYRTFEVVVVNDGGEDISGVLEHYDGRLNLECVVNAQAHGRSQAVNDGVGAARGEYVTFLDDDDVLYPVHLSTLVNGIHGPGDREFVYSHYNHALIEGRGETATVLKHQHLPPWHFDRMDLLAANRPPIHTWLLRRETFEARGGFDPAFDVLHDWDFLLRVTEKLTLEGLPQETCEYRIYLDLDNSVTSGRQRILDDVRLIHERHPASSALVSLSRKLQIARFEFQVGLADELMGKVEAGVMTRDAAALAYIDAVFGFA